MSAINKSLFFDSSVRQKPYMMDAGSSKLIRSMASAEQWLRVIGTDLDRGIFPRVFNGGIVAPSDITVPLSLGEEKVNERERECRNRTEEGTSGSEASGGSWTTSEATPIIGASDGAVPEGELTALHCAYPGIKLWEQEDGMWLLSESSLYRGLDLAVTFLTFVHSKDGIARGWGFWRNAIGIHWIGPRHTNFPDGSICAFSPFDGTWKLGDPLVELLDLYTTWAVRQLYLERFGRWPGPQIAFHPYERLMEFKLDELCDCQSGARYGTCCHSSDLSRNRLSSAVNFTLTHAGGLRRVPPAVLDTVFLGITPPSPTELLS